MMKKDFKRDNPTLAFINAAEEKEKEVIHRGGNRSTTDYVGYDVTYRSTGRYIYPFNCPLHYLIVCVFSLR